ncbi:MAG: Spo0E family sporulation regulatory protein-aspartic acid phosphatase [Clostridiales bacterium]|nr:Spo0E family sporulation regulatory protein-aspartic acid phosphatase [Clostridiales bacterium]
MEKRYFFYIPKNKIKLEKDPQIIDLRSRIKLLQEALSKKIDEKQSLLDDEVYALSLKLDLLINEYSDYKYKRYL